MYRRISSVGPFVFIVRIRIFGYSRTPKFSAGLQRCSPSGRETSIYIGEDVIADLWRPHAYNRASTFLESLTFREHYLRFSRYYTVPRMELMKDSDKSQSTSTNIYGNGWGVEKAVEGTIEFCCACANFPGEFARAAVYLALGSVRGLIAQFWNWTI